MKTIKLFAVLALATQLNSAQAQNLQTGLQACYPLDCDTKNYASTGSSLDGTGVNVTCTTGHGGVANTAYAFGNSSTSYISLPNDSRLKPSRISFSGWVKFNSTSVGQQIVFAQNSCSIFYEGYSFGATASGGTFKLSLAKSGSACWITSQQVVTANTNLSANVWYHVGFYAGPDVLVIYLNGAPDMTPVTNTVLFDYGTTNVILGGTNTSPNAPLDGAMDDVRFYDRKLTTTEFGLLYTNSPACNVSGPTLNDSLQACYPLDCNATNFAPTGSSLNGTPVNVTCATGHTGLANTAYQFNNSTSSYISLPNDSRIKPAKISFSAWVKFISTSVGQQIVFTQNTCSAYYEGYSFGTVVSGGTCKLQLTKSGGCSPTLQQTLIGTSNLSANTWYQVGFYAGSDFLEIYLNGASDVTPAANLVSFNYGSSTLVYLGGTGTFPNSPLNGYMDDVRFYNRKLWDSEFNDLYTLSPACDVTGAGLLNNLQTCYPFNCNAINYAPTAGYPPSLNGQLFNVSCTTGHTGVPNTALQLSGSTSSYIKLPNDARIKPTNAISVTGWCKINSLASSQYIVFAKNSCSAWFEGYTLVATDVGGGLVKYAVVKSSSSIAGCGTQAVLNSTNSYNASSWHHLAFTMDNSAIKLYVDGTLDNSLSSSVQLNYDATDGVYVGGTNVSYFNYPLAGSVDNFRFYNRVITATEVSAINGYDPTCDVAYVCGGNPTNCREAQTVGLQTINGASAGIEVYPNPSSGKFYIRNTKEVSLMVYDINGRSVQFSVNSVDETTNEVNLLDSATGLYFVKIIGADGKTVQTSKIIITR